MASVIIGAVAALILGGVIGALTERGVVRTAFRQLAVVSVAAGVTYLVGSLPRGIDFMTAPGDDMLLAPGTPPGSGRAVRLEDLRIGELLAEGGEGRVFELPLQPHLVVKQYRRPTAQDILDAIVSWPDRITDPALAQRVRAATAWPAASVLDAPAHDGSEAVGAGVLLPRAPRRFALRHRDGTTRLATLSYLTADPAHRAVAYGLSLPDPVSPVRVGLVYALARVLEAFDTGSSVVGHGDLSTKNVLWSLQRGPEVFVIDCDNCEHFGPDGGPLTPAGRRRAMTPNWDDPAVAAGHNPTLASDRYSLALIFLRVVGAANFPIQARQRKGGRSPSTSPCRAGPAATACSGRAPVCGTCVSGV